MAKLTVYIPDDLLDSARTVDAGANTSQLVQRGLERLVGAGAREYEHPPSDAPQLIARAVERLKPAAEHEFQRGYRAALDTVDERFLPLLDELARRRFDLVGWARAWTASMAAAAAGTVPGERYSPPDWWPALAKDLGSLVDPIGWDQFSHSRTQLFVRGYEAALRDLWDQIDDPTGAGAAAHPRVPVMNPDRADRS